jgi:hypothetical protein
MALTADNLPFMIKKLGSQRVWPVSKGCLLFLGSWPHLQYIKGIVFAHLFLLLVHPSCVSKLIAVWYLGHFIHHSCFPFWMNIVFKFSCTLFSNCNVNPDVQVYIMRKNKAITDLTNFWKSNSKRSIEHDIFKKSTFIREDTGT